MAGVATATVEDRFSDKQIVSAIPATIFGQ